MTSNKKPALLLIGTDSMLGYLLKRFAEQSGYRVLEAPTSLPAEKINTLSLAGVVFLSTELLEKSQTMVEEFSGHDTPILVCSSIADEARARELGADYCLLHPLTYDGFLTALADANASKLA